YAQLGIGRAPPRRGAARRGTRVHWAPIEVTMPAVLRVALPLPLPTLFDYLPPDAGEPRVGSRVLVPFGRGKLVGVVVESGVETTMDGKRLKQALRLLDDEALLDTGLMQTLAWAAEYWLGTP